MIVGLVNRFYEREVNLALAVSLVQFSSEHLYAMPSLFCTYKPHYALKGKSISYRTIYTRNPI
jgi:hypothetical protein